MTHVAKDIYVAEVFYTITLPLVQISILLFYREIFKGRRFEVLTYSLGSFVLAWLLAVVLLAFVCCRPPANCIREKRIFIANSIPSILTDIAILCLPVYNVWHLHMSRKLKAAISGLVLLGGL